jgi:hypothetical protein
LKKKSKIGSHLNHFARKTESVGKTKEVLVEVLRSGVQSEEADDCGTTIPRNCPLGPPAETAAQDPGAGA